MFMEERQQYICNVLKQDGKITIAQIVTEFGISEESARRDLRLLEKKGQCKRTHGGAILPVQVGLRPAADRDYSTMPIFENYRLIAQKAAEMIRPNDTVYLTGGSFGYIMLPYLPTEFPFTLVVNNVELAKELRRFDQIEVYLAGGKMRKSGSFVDSLATRFVQQLHFDLSFHTGAGLTAQFGLSNGTDETASFQRAVIENSKTNCLLIPGSKVGADAFIKVCDTNLFDCIITDWECSEDHIASLEEIGCEIIVVEESQ